MDGQEQHEGKVAVVGCGIDTLYFSTKRAVLEEKAELIRAVQARTKGMGERDDARLIQLGEHGLYVQAGGARNAKYRLCNEWMDLLVTPEPPNGRPTVQVELRSILLWQHGADVAVETACRAANDLLVTTTVDGPPFQVSSVDLAVDFQGWTPAPSDEPDFVCRAQHRSSYKTGTSFSGFTFGTGDISARLYNKSLEIQSSDKGWFREIWAKTGRHGLFDSVWRLEFQIRRPGLRTLHSEGWQGGAHSWFDVRASLRELWVYLSTDWLSLRLPRTSETRKNFRPEWAALAASGFTEAPWDGSVVNLMRVREKSRGGRAIAQIAGYVARHAANLKADGIEFAEYEAARVMLDDVRRYCLERGEPFKERVAKHLARLQRDFAVGEKPRARRREASLPLPVPHADHGADRSTASEGGPTDVA